MNNKVLGDYTFNGVTTINATVPEGKAWEIHMLQINSLSATVKSNINISMNGIEKVKNREVAENVNIDFSYKYILEEGQKVTITSSTDTGILNVDIIGLEYDN